MQIPLLLPRSCQLLQEELQQVEDQLLKGARHKWNIDRFAVAEPWNSFHYKDLIRWKRILTRRNFNSQYPSCLPDQDLLSALKITLYT